MLFSIASEKIVFTVRMKLCITGLWNGFYSHETTVDILLVDAHTDSFARTYEDARGFLGSFLIEISIKQETK